MTSNFPDKPISGKDRGNEGLHLLVLVGILAAGAALRAPGMSLPFIHHNEWGQSLFLVLARNYERLGLIHGSVPIFSMLETGPVVYTNHPWLASLLLGLWCKIVGTSELAFRSLALSVSLGTTVAVYALGRQIWSSRTGLVAAFLFALSPLSVDLGRVYGMEQVCLLLLLGVLYFLDRWYKHQRSRDFLATAALLTLAQAADIYGLLFCPFFLLAAVLTWRKDRMQAARYLLLTAIPVLVTGLFLLVLWRQGFLYDTLTLGVGRNSPPWFHWVKTAFWLDVLKKLNNGYTLLLVVAATVGLVSQKKRRDRGSVAWWGVWLLPCLQLLACPRWHEGHDYFAQFFGPALCLQAAYLLVRCKWSKPPLHYGLVALFLVAFVIDSRIVIKESWSVQNDNDVKLALQIRELTSDQDLIIGLPPRMAYYVDRKHIVPYFSLARGDYDNQPARFYSQIQSYCQNTSYERVIVFDQFLEPPYVDIDGADYSKCLEGLDEFELVSKPGLDPHVWKRTP